MDITLRISETGEMTVIADGQETPVGSIDEAMASIKALADEALQGAGGAGGAGPEPGADMGAPDEGAQSPAQALAAQELGMMQGFKSRAGKGSL